MLQRSNLKYYLLTVPTKKKMCILVAFRIRHFQMDNSIDRVKPSKRWSQGSSTKLMIISRNNKITLTLHKVSIWLTVYFFNKMNATASLCIRLYWMIMRPLISYVKNQNYFHPICPYSFILESGLVVFFCWIKLS